MFFFELEKHKCEIVFSHLFPTIFRYIIFPLGLFILIYFIQGHLLFDEKFSDFCDEVFSVEKFIGQRRFFLFIFLFFS